MKNSTHILKSRQEIEVMRQGGVILANILEQAKGFVRPGTPTGEIDKFVGRLCLKYKVTPAFKGYNNYPANICVSINDEVVHGIPTPTRIIREGDIVSLDFGVLYKGYNTDAALSFVVGNGSALARNLVSVCEQSFWIGLEQVFPGNTLGDLGQAISNTVEKAGYSVVRALAGHGIGKNIHEEPIIPNYGRKGTGLVIKEGMVLAIEPMVCEKNFEVKLLADGWTYASVDGGLTSHFEHTIAVTGNGPIILTEK